MVKTIHERSSQKPSKFSFHQTIKLLHLQNAHSHRHKKNKTTNIWCYHVLIHLKTLEPTLEPNNDNISVWCHLHTCSCKVASCVSLSLSTSSSLSNLSLTRGTAAAVEHKLPHQRLFRRTGSQQHHAMGWERGRAWKDALDGMQINRQPE